MFAIILPTVPADSIQPAGSHDCGTGLVPSCPMTWLDSLADKALNCDPPTREEALAVLAHRRRRPDGRGGRRVPRQAAVLRRRVKLNYLVNIKSGLCPEDCFYCSQRVGSARRRAQVQLAQDRRGARQRRGGRGGRGAPGLPGRQRPGPDRQGHRPGVPRRSPRSSRATPRWRSAPASACCPTGRPSACASAGTTAYNHNLNTSGGHYADICTTHEYADRVSTVESAKSPASRRALA